MANTLREIKKQHELPIYTWLEELELVIIGFDPNIDSSKDPNKESDFLDEIDTIDNLIFQSPFDVIRAHRDQDKRSYETAALNEHPDNNHSLEEGIDKVELAVKYGIRVDLYHMYQQLRHFSKAVEVYAVCEDSTLTDGTLNKQVKALVRKYKNEVNLIREVGIIFERYMQRVLQFEVLGPRCLELVTQLAGKKGLLIENKYRRFIMRYLTGKQVNQPDSWNDYVNSLDKKYAVHKEAIRRIETEIFPAVK